MRITRRQLAGLAPLFTTLWVAWACFRLGAGDNLLIIIQGAFVILSQLIISSLLVLDQELIDLRQEIIESYAAECDYLRRSHYRYRIQPLHLTRAELSPGGDPPA